MTPPNRLGPSGTVASQAEDARRAPGRQPPGLASRLGLVATGGLVGALMALGGLFSAAVRADGTWAVPAWPALVGVALVGLAGGIGTALGVLSSGRADTVAAVVHAVLERRQTASAEPRAGDVQRELDALKADIARLSRREDDAP